MKQQLGAEAPHADGMSIYRFAILQRPVSHALRLTRQHALVRRQIVGWSVVAGIFTAALASWGILILAALSIYRSL